MISISISIPISTLSCQSNGSSNVNINPQPDIAWYTSIPDADTFTISTAAELLGLAFLVNRNDSAINFSGKTFILNDDIDLSIDTGYGKSYNGGRGWIPIGKDSAHCFRGNFNGNRKVIRGLYINDTTLFSTGLFGVIGDSATVSNLGIENADIRGGDNVGCVVGTVVSAGLSHISNVAFCYANGTAKGRNRVGGIAGFVGGHGAIIDRCYSAADVLGYCCVGGIAGHVDDGGGANGRTVSVVNCYSDGKVQGEFSCVGGIVGELRAGLVATCAALNPSVHLANSALPNVGRVVGKLGEDSVVVLVDNIASGRMGGGGGGGRSGDVWTNRGLRAKDGADIADVAVERDLIKEKIKSFKAFGNGALPRNAPMHDPPIPAVPSPHN